MTVPHSGTTWARELLGGWGLEFETHHADVEPADRLAWPSGGRRLVVPLRDPVLVEISALNRGRWVDFRLWGLVAGWWPLENVHFLRVGCPVGERLLEADLLARFLGVFPTPEVDWTPKNASHDNRGLKAKYARRELAPELGKVWDWLVSEAAAPVRTLFRDHGYDLPWL